MFQPEAESKDNVLRLQPIDVTSPTLAQEMRTCMLRAGLSNRGAGNSHAVLSHPGGWLGTAYHEVLDKAADIDSESGDTENRLKDIWNSKILELYEASQQHPLNRRLGAPDSWPKYHLTEQMAYLKAKELIARNTVAKGGQRTADSIIREEFLSGFSGRLVGRPDVANRDSVIDYKSGYVLEVSDGIESLKDSYVRQLKIYAYLIHENRGYWPRRGVVEPMVGGPVEISLEPAECESEAIDAVALLDSFNSRIETGQSPESLASPAPDSCHWCPFQIACQPFWDQVAPEWYEVMQIASVEGKLMGKPKVVQDGAAIAISVESQSGTETANALLVSPFPTKVFGDLEVLIDGEAVRVVGAYRKSNGSLGASLRTLVAGVSYLPKIEIDLATCR